MYLSTTIFALILVSGLGSPLLENNGHSEFLRLEVLMASFKKWVVQKGVPKRGPLVYKNQARVKYDNTFLEAKVSISYLTFLNETEAEKVVEYTRTDPKTLVTNFKIRVPEIEVTYKYKMNGTILSHNVSGEGILRYRTINATVTVSDLKFHDHKHNLQIASMKVGADFEDLIMEFTGLHVIGMEVRAFEKVLQSRILSLLKKSFDFSKFQSDKLKTDLNTFMHGKSLQQIVRWMDKHTKHEFII